MTRAAANGIDIEYDTFGDKNGTPLLLIMGLNSQMVAWPESFCQKLAQNGHWVLRFDKFDETLEKELSANSYDRSFYPFGFIRQLGLTQKLIHIFRWTNRVVPVWSLGVML